MCRSTLLLVGCATGVWFALTDASTLAQTASADFSSAHELIRAAPLEQMPQDPAAEMVAGVNRFLLRKIEHARAARSRYWTGEQARSENLQFLSQRLGLTPRARGSTKIQYQLPSIASARHVSIFAIRWPVLNHPSPHLSSAVSLWGEGLMAEPEQPSDRLLIVVPDADETPEQFFGGQGSERADLVSRFINSGFTVVVPAPISRRVHQHGQAEMTRREYLQRAAFELGRTLAGYEVQTLQAAIDQLAPDTVVVCGFGEGGMTALLCGAVDERVDLTVCCGYFGPRESLWQQPVSRNIFGLLERFGDAELAAAILPRGLVVHTSPSYEVRLQTAGGAPASWQSPSGEQVRAEFARLDQLRQSLAGNQRGKEPVLLVGEDPAQISQPIVSAAADMLGMPELALAPGKIDWDFSASSGDPTTADQRREDRLLATIDAHNQALLVESEYARKQFMNLGLPRDDAPDGSNRLDTSSSKHYEASIAPFRDIFREEVVGWFDDPILPHAARAKASYSSKRWTGYDVMLDLFPDVFAYGVLLLPKDLRGDERRPVVVCQHGLEGRPQDTFQGDHRAYHDFAARLADRGFIVFAPQNLYIGKDDFRTLQRQANTIGKSLFSVIAPQHQQILNWLAELPCVDPNRIAFYGLSYGGKSAMRLPALLPDYCLSICSADFNDWVWKNASSRSRYSYLGTGEYEIFEFDLGSKFNYAEMAALIAPRPFMVERGHFDGVAPDDRVAKEFAKVRFLYQARLGLEGRSEIEWFSGPHTIHGQGTFSFLHRHLDWPEPK